MIIVDEICASNGSPRGGTQDQTWKRGYTRYFQILTDDARIGAKAVREALPVAIGQIYDTGFEADNGSFCVSITVSELSGSDDGCQWVATVEYGQFQALERPQNPTEERPKMSFNWAQFETPAVVDIHGDPLVNSAGDYFDPPLMQDDSRPVMTIVRKEPRFDIDLVDELRDTINNAPWFGKPAKSWKCSNITGEEDLNADIGYYWIVTYEYALKRDGGWEKVLDQGLNEINASGKKVKIVDEKGAYVGSPWPLNEDGSKKAPGEPGDFIEIEKYREVDYAIFGLDDFYNDQVVRGLL